MADSLGEKNVADKLEPERWPPPAGGPPRSVLPAISLPSGAVASGSYAPRGAGSRGRPRLWRHRGALAGSSSGAAKSRSSPLSLASGQSGPCRRLLPLMMKRCRLWHLPAGSSAADLPYLSADGKQRRRHLRSTSCRKPDRPSASASRHASSTAAAGSASRLCPRIV